MWLWIALTVAVVAFELWYAVAFLVAYGHIREQMLLLPMAQALMMLAAFAYIGVAVINGWLINSIIVLGLLIGALVISLYWRRAPAGLAQFLRSYPRGTLDVLAFRRPVADLKRRVRTK
ncbi:MAG: hypothetical protein HGA45_20700 [Chloroflexales bacterium]|nr:hypothetical protein [Chloroflexales bacterium]